MYSLSHARVNFSARVFMSAWAAAIHNSFLHAFDSDAVDLPLRPIANRFGGCFCLGSGPVFCFWFVFCCLLRCFRWRNASLAGGFAGRRLWCVCGFRFVVTSICLFHGLFVLVQSLVCLLTCKDRAISATSATLEEKK